jgi:hypothetical protein
MVLVCSKKLGCSTQPLENGRRPHRHAVLLQLVPGEMVSYPGALLVDQVLLGAVRPVALISTRGLGFLVFLQQSPETSSQEQQPSGFVALVLSVYMW